MIDNLSQKLAIVDCRPFAKWASGFTRRWHMNAAMSHFEDFVCGHHGRCGMLVMVLFPDHSIEFLRAAITHDAGEFTVGDLSSGCKRTGGDLVDQHAKLEDRVLESLGFAQDLPKLDERRLKFVDVFDAYLFVELRRPIEVSRSGWAQAKQWLISEAVDLDCGAVVDGMLWDSTNGDLS